MPIFYLLLLLGCAALSFRAVWNLEATSLDRIFIWVAFTFLLFMGIVFVISCLTTPEWPGYYD